MATKVAVVTGANKGIGFAIVRELCKQFKGDVILTARNENLGKVSVSLLQKHGLKPKFQQLDLLDRSTMEGLKSYLLSEYGGLDVLVNNAGIYMINSTAPFSKQAEITIRTNYEGTLDVCNVLFPILNPHARVVNVSSRMASLALSQCSDENRGRLTNPDMSIPQLTSILDEFIRASQTDTLSDGGWPDMAYGISKVGVTAFSIIQQRQFDDDPETDIVVNACCPGRVATDLNNFHAPLSPEQGAVTPVYLALLPEDISHPRGRYVKDKRIMLW